jgi:hypothetical protein
MENFSRWWCYCFYNYFFLCYICLLLMEKYFNWSLNFRSCWRFLKPHNTPCFFPYNFLCLHVPNHCLVGINYFLLIQYGYTKISARMDDCIYGIGLLITRYVLLFTFFGTLDNFFIYDNQSICNKMHSCHLVFFWIRK